MVTAASKANSVPGIDGTDQPATAVCAPSSAALRADALGHMLPCARARCAACTPLPHMLDLPHRYR
jgi:hypothetical protein